VLDLVGALREHVDQLPRDTGDLWHMPAGPPLQTERGGELFTEHRLEHLTRCTGMPIQVGVGERRPLAIGALDEVCDQAVPVQQWVSCT
jgi:hypothetical protein